MIVDLYRSDLRNILPTDLYESIYAFCRFDLPLKSRPTEGYLLDFKQDWSDSVLHTVAGFANTFGGLLFLGIGEVSGQPEQIVGISSKSEFKTDITNRLMTGIVPFPPAEVAVCPMPQTSDRSLSVIRVRESEDLHFITKGEKPVYVRVGDASRPANAEQLRALIQRKSRAENPESDRSAQLHNSLIVTKEEQPGRRTQSHTVLRIVISPRSRMRLRLDRNLERTFSNEVEEHFRLRTAMPFDAEHHRDRHWAELRFRFKDIDYERRWRITADGDIGFITQTAFPIPMNGATKFYWSLFDLVADFTYFLRVARDLWKEVEYFGEAKVTVNMNVQGVELFVNAAGFEPIYYQDIGPKFKFTISRELLAVVTNPNRFNGNAELNLDYSSLNGNPSLVVAELTNDLMRSFGHLVPDLDDFDKRVTALLR